MTRPEKRCDTARGTILVVDDESLIRTLCQRVLEHLGFTVLVAEDGMRALDIYLRHQNDIAIILSDISMPRKDGLELAEDIYTLNEEAAIILMTGYDSQLELPGKLHRVCAFLQKPFSPDILIAAVEGCLCRTSQEHVPA